MQVAVSVISGKGNGLVATEPIQVCLAPFSRSAEREGIGNHSQHPLGAHDDQQYGSQVLSCAIHLVDRGLCLHLSSIRLQSSSTYLNLPFRSFSACPMSRWLSFFSASCMPSTPILPCLRHAWPRASLWRVYIDSLPKEHSIPLYFNPDQMAQLRGTSIFLTSLNLFKSIVRQYCVLYHDFAVRYRLLHAMLTLPRSANSPIFPFKKRRLLSRISGP